MDGVSAWGTLASKALYLASQPRAVELGRPGTTEPAEPQRPNGSLMCQVDDVTSKSEPLSFICCPESPEGVGGPRLGVGPTFILCVC